MLPKTGSADPTARRQILTINVEDYFHVWALRDSNAVRRKHWDRLDPRLDASLGALLDLLRAHGAKGTFFVFGCIADSQPHLVELILRDGHEVASRGYFPRMLEGLSRQEFADDLGLAKRALERVTGRRVLGYRSPSWISPDQLWVLEALADAGYTYDSSVNPVLLRFAKHPEFFRIHEVTTPRGRIREFPITTASFAGIRIAISGGNYARQFPHGVMSRAVANHVMTGAPAVFYFMPWELDETQPHISGLSLMSNVRQYRNLSRTRWLLAQYLTSYPFHGIADELSLVPEEVERPAPAPALEVMSEEAPPSRPLEPVTLVVPIFNEDENIGYLRRSLEKFRSRLARRFRLHLILVDDASTDDTFRTLQAEFGSDPDARVIRHEQNRGVAASILTGLRAASTEIVCSIDCDCSYDPEDLADMLPLLDGNDMVTASPYHPAGGVMNVPRWRLFLSKSLSRMYNVVLDADLSTYTSCCRVYRKSAIENIELTNQGFLGVAETLIEVKRRGGRVVEYPAVLEARLFGESKMKIVHTIGRHLGLLSKLVGERWRGGSESPQRAP
jgi:polysaccharide deacetylase family protein (PEP-CTERM system associated)